jgi:hypothetical protein
MFSFKKQQLNTALRQVPEQLSSFISSSSMLAQPEQKAIKTAFVASWHLFLQLTGCGGPPVSVGANVSVYCL